MKTAEHSTESSRQQGSTLLESLVALSCLSIGLLGFFSSHGIAAQVDQTSSALTAATHIAMTLATGVETLASSGQFDGGLEGCSSLPSDPVSDLCVSLSPVNRAGREDLELGPLTFHPSYAVTSVSAFQQRISVRVRYPVSTARCLECTDPVLSSGWKAVTLTSLRYVGTGATF